MTDPPPSLMEHFCGCLKAANWRFTPDLTKGIIFLIAADEVSFLRCTILVKESDCRIILLINLERRCPAPYLDIMKQFCNKINHSIAVGFFAVDTRDGEVRFRHSADLKHLKISPTFVNNFLKQPIHAVRANYEVIQTLLDGFSLEAALKRQHS
jgi:hypothetical protein